MLLCCAAPVLAQSPAQSPAQSSTAAAKQAAAPAAASTAASAAASAAADPGIVRGLYVNRFAAQSTKRMKQLIQMADETEVNALIIDIKDEFGLNYESSDPKVQRNAGKAGVIKNLAALLDTLRAHKILAVARIVVFKDSVTARVNPAWDIRKADGSPWRDKKGMLWVNPYNRELGDYNIRVAEEAAKLGFGEIQFDYIRFPEPYKSLPPQVFPGSNNEPKPAALAEYLKLARTRLSKLGVRTTADIFGLVTTVPGALEVGQEWEKVAPVTDVLLPMVYPSHYPPGSFNIPRPNADPYKTIFMAISKAHDRNNKLGLTGERVRPWLQAFTLGKPAYGPEEIREQKRAVYDAGYDGWVLWHPGSKYEPFLAGLEKTTVSRKKAYVTPAAAPARR